MQITKVEIFPYKGSKSLRAFASVVFDKCFVIKGLQVMNGQNGLFVKMPQKQVKDEWKDVCHPITKDLYAHIQEEVLAAARGFREQNNNNSGNQPPPEDDLPF